MLRKVKFSSPEDEFKDYGLGRKFSDKRQRIISKDGSFNIRRTGMPWWLSFSMYHELLSMSWTRFNLFVLLTYVVINTVFALLYLLVGVHELAGAQGGGPLQNFLDAFFFSGQALTTVGFGRISPVGMGASIIAAVESMFGLLGFALATGLLYGRFSRPNVRLVYSASALIAPYKEINAFMFRIINARKNQLIELEMQVIFSRLERMENGELIRRYYALELERAKVNFFPANWTIVHPIVPSSPLAGTTEDELRESSAEFLILFKAFDDTFSQTVHSRHSYTYDEVVWGAKFESVFTNTPGETTVFDMEKFHAYSPARLN